MRRVSQAANLRPTLTVDQAIIALRKGAALLKYGRRGRPHFCHFKLLQEPDGSYSLQWVSNASKGARKLDLASVNEIRLGQRTEVFRRHLRPHVDYLSFSLIYDNHTRSLDVVCKDSDELEMWLVGLQALTSDRSLQRSTSTASTASANLGALTSRSGASMQESPLANGAWGFENNTYSSAYSSSYGTFALPKSASSPSVFSVPASDFTSPGSTEGVTAVGVPVKFPSVSSQTQVELGDVYCWGEGMRGRDDNAHPIDALTPIPIFDMAALDVRTVSCGQWHAALVISGGQCFTWGETRGPHLGHGAALDAPTPQMVSALAGISTEQVACGAFHTAVVTVDGQLFTWGDGLNGSGVLGHGNDNNQWVPKLVRHSLEGVRVKQISCGPWHTALTTDEGELYTWGDGSFGTLGHGDRSSCHLPRPVEALSAHRSLMVACGVWHTAAVVEEAGHPDKGGVAYTWGDGDKGRLGHGDKEDALFPRRVDALWGEALRQVACGKRHTVALTMSGVVYSWGCNDYGQLGIGDNPPVQLQPILVQGKLHGVMVGAVACGMDHTAALGDNGAGVFTWGCGTNGRLGLGDVKNRTTPDHVTALRNRRVIQISCGASSMAVVCRHQDVSQADTDKCFTCKTRFGLGKKKRHTCYQCGHAFCGNCTSNKVLNATLAPYPDKPSRVCDPCFKSFGPESKVGTLVAAAKATQDARLPAQGGRPPRAPPAYMASASFTESQLTSRSQRSQPLPTGTMSPSAVLHRPLPLNPQAQQFLQSNFSHVLQRGSAPPRPLRSTGSHSSLKELDALSDPPSSPTPNDDTLSNTTGDMELPSPSDSERSQWGRTPKPHLNMAIANEEDFVVAIQKRVHDDDLSVTVSRKETSIARTSPINTSTSRSVKPSNSIGSSLNSYGTPGSTSVPKPSETAAESRPPASDVPRAISELEERCQRAEREVMRLRSLLDATAKASNKAKATSNGGQSRGVTSPTRTLPVLTTGRQSEGAGKGKSAPRPTGSATNAKATTSASSSAGMVRATAIRRSTLGATTSSNHSSGGTSPGSSGKEQVALLVQEDSYDSASSTPHAAHPSSRDITLPVGTSNLAYNGGEQEWVEEVDEGVFMTVVRAPTSAANELKSVQFSRDRFEAGAAEKWWDENRQQVLAALESAVPPSPVALRRTFSDHDIEGDSTAKSTDSQASGPARSSVVHIFPFNQNDSPQSSVG
eukprot:jgi/Chlat1/8790/Chrsp90S08135